jgi:RNA-binding motif X-linked protein 2
MNRVTKIQNLNKINERELDLNIAGNLNKSWHQNYSDSSWIYIGGLPYELNEGDVLAVFSQYGEIVNINLIRDSKTGKSKGFAFVCYQDQRSTILAVDNFNGMKLLTRLIQVDHVDKYKVPKYKESVPEDIRQIWEEGCAPKPINIPEAQLKAEVVAEKRATKRKLEQYETVVPLEKEKVSKELKKMRKAHKKEKKEMKKLKKREKARIKHEQEGTPDEERGNADDVGRWDLKKKKLDLDDLDYEKFYGANDHFNFGKGPKASAATTHNIRPDFDKADWRDIEMFKIMREHDKKEKGEVRGKNYNDPEKDAYVPRRLGPNK